MGKFLVIEGLDGSGKSTQIQMLRAHLKERQVGHHYIHFPRTNEGIYGEMIARFLRGEFGDVNAVNPYIVALLYAGDRADAKEMIARWLTSGDAVIVDRYVYSNVAFQCAKVDSSRDKQELRDWILDIEYKHNQIPMPDVSLYLNMPFDFIRRSLAKVRQGAAREYLLGKTDIHEASIDLQKKVEAEYLQLARDNNDLYRIDCCGTNGQPLAPERIHARILEVLRTKGVC